MNRSDEDGQARTETGHDLDFERADFGDTAEQVGTGTLRCSICESPISDSYFTRDGSFVCARCEGPVRAAGPPSSRFGRLLGALVGGTLAAIAASALWMAVTHLTGYEIGLIAIAVGWIVGVAIQIGNRGVGGLPYQLTAVFLTYTAIVMTYVPMLVTELRSPEPPTNAARASATDPSFFGLGGSEADPTPTDADESGALAMEESEQIEIALENSELLVWLVAIPLAYAVPFLAGFENAIGILIIGFALYQAWKMTAKTQIQWAGPFQVGSEKPG